MPTSLLKALALVAILSLIATTARSDGIGSFENNRGIFGSFASFGVKKSSGGGTCTNRLDFSKACNSQYLIVMH